MKLTTERLYIREFSTEDVGDLVEGINNINVSKWLLTVPHPYEKEDGEWFVNHCSEDANKKPRDNYELAIELKEENKVVGGIALSKIKIDDGSAHVGYWLGEKYWRKGIGSEALGAVLGFAFDNLKLKKIEAYIFEGNEGSCNLFKKFGAEYKGRREESVKSKSDGKFHDDLVYTLLKENWKK